MGDHMRISGEDSQQYYDEQDDAREMAQPSNGCFGTLIGIILAIALLIYSMAS